MSWLRRILCVFGFHSVVDDGQENNPMYAQCQSCLRKVEIFR